MALPSSTNPVGVDFEEIAQNIFEALAEIEWQTWGKAGIYVVLGFIVASFASTIISRIFSKYTSEHYTHIIRRMVYYSVIVLSLLLALTTLHLDVKVLGIATVLTLAIGFASQTAISNVITGLFLVFEKPFQVGDLIQINDTMGELLSIDLLSIKLRTLENTQVRIPNELLLKTQFINLTKWPIRRLDIKIRVQHDEDLDKVKKVLFELAARTPMVLESPTPQLVFVEFSESAVVFKFCVWVRCEYYLSFKDIMPLDIQKAFKENNLKIPAMKHIVEMSN